MSTEQILQDCTIDGLVVKLPNIQLDRNDYLSVKKKLELIGGKWKGGKVSGFVFQNDPSSLLESIANGESRNIKKEFQFFATPDGLADKLVALAEIDQNHMVLEPSAGQGAIVKAIHRAIDVKVWCYELMDQNVTILMSNVRGSLTFLGYDFLSNDNGYLFDRIVANPPFSKNQDIDHVQKMYDSLKSGGRLVSIMSKHFQFAEGKKEQAFRDWINEKSAAIIDVDSGAFKASGTMVSTVIVVIDKV